MQHVVKMADFYSILARAVDALDANTREARLSLYQRAREAVIAEARGSDPALNQSEFHVAWRSLEEAIGKVEAQLQRERFIQRPTAPTSTPLPRGGTVAAPARPAIPTGEQRRGLMRFLSRAFRRDSDGASRKEPGRPSGDRDSKQGSDTWLSDLLARASRDEHERSHDQAGPRRGRRRNG